MDSKGSYLAALSSLAVLGGMIDSPPDGDALDGSPV